MTGYRYFMCGGVKWNSMIFTASKVRTPVSAGNCGLRMGAAGFAETGAGTSRVSRASVTLYSLDEDGARRVAGSGLDCGLDYSRVRVPVKLTLVPVSSLPLRLVTVICVAPGLV